MSLRTRDSLGELPGVFRLVVPAAALWVFGSCSEPLSSSQQDPNAPPWFEEDWTQFENNGDINALPYMTTFGATQGRVNVETALTGTPWGGDHGIRVQVDAGACGPQPEVGVRITDIPNSAVDQPREIWWEVYVKWSLNYATSWGCSTGSEHKFLPHYDDSGSRWHLMVGSFGDQIRTYLDASSPTGNPVIQWRIPAVTVK